MNKKKIIVGVTIVVVLLVIFLAIKNNDSPKDINTQTKNTSSHTIPVKAHIVKPQELGNNVITTGTVLANEEVDLKSEVSGKIVKIAFKEGSRVKKGDLLVKINDSELQAQLMREKYQFELLKDKEYRQKKTF